MLFGFQNDAKPLKRDCYAAIRHKQETDTVIQIRDCIVVNSGDNSSQSQQYGESGAPSKRSYVGKVADFFTSPNGKYSLNTFFLTGFRRHLDPLNW